MMTTTAHSPASGRAISAVIFDMDGLMLDTERIALRVWREAARELGYDLDDALAHRMVGRSAATNRLMLQAHFGQPFSFDDLSTLAEGRYREVLAAEGVPRKPGLVELLEMLRARGVPRAVATSTARELARHKLAQAGVLSYFEIVVGGDEVTHGKPAPDIFLRAADRMGERPPDCAVLEDSAPGIQAASAAGMVPILVPDGDRRPPAETCALAACVVDSLPAAQLVLERLLAAGRPPASF
jgi:HAD superfamily hydrolase (TIGR01509 family)